MQAKGELEFLGNFKPEPGEFGYPEAFIQIGDQIFHFEVSSIFTERLSTVMSRVKLNLVGADVMPVDDIGDLELEFSIQRNAKIEAARAVRELNAVVNERLAKEAKNK